jgi:hypothetical protein
MQPDEARLRRLQSRLVAVDTSIKLLHVLLF